MHPPTPSMVAIPGGVVDLRDDQRDTRWQVEIAPFLLGTLPVTRCLLDPAASSTLPLTNIS